jgi:hypothetical protein
MGWGDRVHFLHRFQDAVIDDLDPRNSSTVDRFKSNGGNLRGILEATSFGIRQLPDACIDRHTMVGNRLLGFRAVFADLNEATTNRGTDPFNATSSELTLIGHVEKSVLETGRSQIGNEYFHVSILD